MHYSHTSGRKPKMFMIVKNILLYTEQESAACKQRFYCHMNLWCCRLKKEEREKRLFVFGYR